MKAKLSDLFTIIASIVGFILPHIASLPDINPWWVNVGQITSVIVVGSMIILLDRLKLLWHYLLYDKEDTRKDKIGVILVLLLVIIGAVCLVRELASTESGAYFIQHILTPKD